MRRRWPQSIIKFLLLSVVALTLGRPAYAGHWTIQYNCSGAETVSDDDGTHTYPWPTDTDIEHSAGSPSAYSAVVDGSITITCNWVHDQADNSDLPPTQILVSEYGDALAQGSWSSGSNHGNATWSVDNGLGSPVVTDSNNPQISCSGHKYWLLGNAGHSESVTLPTRHIHASATIPHGTGYSGTVWVDARYSGGPGNLTINSSAEGFWWNEIVLIQWMTWN